MQEKNTCGEGASDVSVMGNYWATGRKWAAVGVGFPLFGGEPHHVELQVCERAVGSREVQTSVF